MKPRTSGAHRPVRKLINLALLSAMLFAVTFVVGCGDSSGAKDQVSGKVTLNGQGVNGFVVFVGADKKEAQGPLLNGIYHIDNPPKGEVDVLVKGMGGPVGPAPTPPKDSSTTGTLGGTSGGAAPPPKYAVPGALPKFKVTGGKQTHDITLQP